MLWVAKQCVAFYLDLVTRLRPDAETPGVWEDRKADASVGYYGRCLVVTGVAMVFWIQVQLRDGVWCHVGTAAPVGDPGSHPDGAGDVRDRGLVRQGEGCRGAEEADQAKQTGQSSPKKEKKKDK